MSLILDALNKADNERSKSSPPSINSNHGLNTDQEAPNRYKTIVFSLAGLIALIAIFLSYILLDLSPTPSRSDTLATISNHQEFEAKTFEQAEALPIVDQSEAEPEIPANTTKAEENLPTSNSEKYQRIKKKLIAAQYQKAIETKSDDITQTINDTLKPDSTLGVTSIYQQRENVEKETTSPSHKATDTDSLDRYANLSFIGDLPYSIQKSIPTIMYSAHNFANDPATVTLNNTKRQKGQQIGDDLYLEDIAQDGIVIRFKSRKFKMVALNSWVNI